MRLALSSHTENGDRKCSWDNIWRVEMFKEWPEDNLIPGDVADGKARSSDQRGDARLRVNARSIAEGSSVLEVAGLCPGPGKLSRNGVMPKVRGR